MKRVLFVAGILFFTVIACLRADEAIASAQQALKDQGFYYGEITGRKDADTTAAIRRYQIRNGLKISGNLDVETQRSLQLPSAGTRQPTTPTAPTNDTSDLREDTTGATQPPPQYRPPREATPPIYAPEPHDLRPETAGIFDGTPYEMAPLDLQQRVIAGAQIFLARIGYYRSDVDGIYGPGTEFALRAFQSRSGLPPTGRLDMQTLNALRLLPGEHLPSPTRRIPPRLFPRPVYRGQWVPG
jgi:peptidoglycan hydrolase-like protein with peptidoglycan-binding domain